MIKRFQKGGCDMTIKEFASLCGCNPQTLRYYDHTNLLKPVKVDEWTGYRYYDEEQALSFVKIKNLQTAGFTIEEIKALLDASDEEVYDAFTAKIEEQRDRLQKMLDLRQSYQNEMAQMKIKIKEVVDSIKKDMADYDPTEEFGMDKATYDKHTADVTKMFEDMLDETNIENVKLPGDTEDYDKKVDIDKEFLKNPMWEVVYENHGWDFVKDFYDKFSQLEDGREYSLLFLVREDKSNRTGFSNTIMSMLLDSNEGKNRKLNCNVYFSEDNKNHFWLLKKRV